jgi:isoprenylcysteine carboxyl methyltransferase (ICMT) family protein YpbQ
MHKALVGFFCIAVVLRLGSLWISRRNERRLRAEGCEEYGAANTRCLAMLHVAYYAGAFVEGLWRESQFDAWTWLGAAVYGFSIVVLFSVIFSLGRLWSVKLLLARGHVLKSSGPFRFVRHPNYVGMVLELAGLAVVLKAWVVLILVGPLYGWSLLQRIRVENEVMRQRFPEYG